MDTRYSLLSRALGAGSLVRVGGNERQRTKWHAPRSRALPTRYHIEAALLNLAHIAKRRRQRGYELMR
jgi:hypothetical protein